MYTAGGREHHFAQPIAPKDRPRRRRVHPSGTGCHVPQQLSTTSGGVTSRQWWAAALILAAASPIACGGSPATSGGTPGGATTWTCDEYCGSTQLGTYTVSGSNIPVGSTANTLCLANFTFVDCSCKGYSGQTADCKNCRSSTSSIAPPETPSRSLQASATCPCLPNGTAITPATQDQCCNYGLIGDGCAVKSVCCSKSSCTTDADCCGSQGYVVNTCCTVNGVGLQVFWKPATCVNHLCTGGQSCDAYPCGSASCLPP